MPRVKRHWLHISAANSRWMCIQSIAPLPHTRFPLIDQKNGLLLKGGSFKIRSWVRKVWVPLVNTFSSSVTTALPSLKFSFSSVEHAFPGLVFIPVLKYINKSWNLYYRIILPYVFWLGLPLVLATASCTLCYIGPHSTLADKFIGF